jgi:hypothetical protein
MQSMYSFQDVVAVFFHPLVGSFEFRGEGMGSFTITNTTDRTQHDVASDGSVMVSYIAGGNGAMQIEAQQTSDLHKFLLNWFNIISTAANLQDVSNWATALVTIRSILDGSTHILKGVSPAKVPDKTYGQAGARVTWSLMAADVLNA